MRPTPSEQAALPIPPELAGLIESGQWRHPGGDALRVVIPTIEDIEFLGSINQIRQQSAALQSGSMGALPATDPRSAALPRISRGHTLLIASNIDHGNDVAIALDYRTSMAEPRVIASAMAPDGSWQWHEVAPSFPQFVALFQEAASRKENLAEARLAAASKAKPEQAPTAPQALIMMLVGASSYLLDCQFQAPKHPDVTWIQSGLYGVSNLLFEASLVVLGIYSLLKALDRRKE